MTRWLQAAKQVSGPLTEPTMPTEPPAITQPEGVLSVKSVLSGGELPVLRATRPPVQKLEIAPSAGEGANAFPHGISVTGEPRTWTGRVVSLDAWRSLTDWEKHGPNGQHWNGITQTWETPK